MKKIMIGNKILTEIIVDDDFDIDVSEAYLVNGHVTIPVNNSKIYLKKIVAGDINPNTKYRQINGNRDDFRKENIIKHINNCNVPEMYGKKYMGTRRDKTAVKYYKNKRYDLHAQNEYEAARKYNAMCDYFGIDCYRNKVEKIELTKDEIKKIKLKEAQ